MIGGVELQASDEEGDKLGNGSDCHEMDAADVLTLQMRVGGIGLCCTLSCPLNSDGESQPRLSAIFPTVESIHMGENMRWKWQQLQESEVVGCVRASGDFKKFWLQWDYISRSQTVPTLMAMSTATVTTTTATINAQPTRWPRPQCQRVVVISDSGSSDQLTITTDGNNDDNT